MGLTSAPSVAERAHVQGIVSRKVKPHHLSKVEKEGGRRRKEERKKACSDETEGKFRTGKTELIRSISFYLLRLKA